LAHQGQEVLTLSKSGNRPLKIAEGIPVASDPASDTRQYPAKVKTEHRTENWNARLAEFQNQHSPPWTNNTMHLLQARQRIADISDPEGNGHQIELPIFERQPERIAPNKPRPIGSIPDLPVCEIEHRGAKITAHGMGTGPSQIDRQITSSGTNIERRLSRHDTGEFHSGSPP
jgi:hypothetical protein